MEKDNSNLSQDESPGSSEEELLSTDADGPESEEDEFRRLKRQLILKLIHKGLSEKDGFCLLDAENHLADFGSIEPSEQVVRIVLENLVGPAHAQDFDLIRISGYLRDRRLVTALENHFSNLKDIWREFDELRYYESNRFVLENVLRRAKELSSLQVAVDRYLQTLDNFFEAHFNLKKVEKFPELASAYKGLLFLRRSGKLKKGNIESVLRDAVDRVVAVIERRLEQLKSRKGGDKIRPNRLISVYYCLLEALINQGSDIVQVDEEFLEKVSQDFRASHGDGTKRFVLSALLKMENVSFGDIAAEAAYSIKARTIEKMERREAGETAFRYQKVALDEMQNFDLYETASDVIARSPSDKVFEFLLLSFNPGALLLGLRALEKSELAQAVKLKHIRLLLERGTMDEYVFTRIIQNLSEIKSPGAAELLGKLLTERYGWRKTKMPAHALEMIQEGIYLVSGGAVASLAKAFGGEDRMPDEATSFNLPYEEAVYDGAFGRFANHFKRNIFHGTSELAQHRLARAMLSVAFGSRATFSERGKKSAASLIGRLNNVSDQRLDVMLEELCLEIERSGFRLKSLAGKEKKALADLLTELRGTRGALQKVRNRRPDEERELRGLVKALKNTYSMDKPGRLEKIQLDRALLSVFSLGASRMIQRDKNLREGARKSGKLDPAMLSIRYPAASKTIIEAAMLLHKHLLESRDERARQVFDSFVIELMHEPPRVSDSPPPQDETRSAWEELRKSLAVTITRECAGDYLEMVALVTSGAAAHGFDDILDEMKAFIYDNLQPAAIRLAHLISLPPVPSFADRWSELLGLEDESVFLALRHYLSSRTRKMLKQFVPDLLDLLD